MTLSRRDAAIADRSRDELRRQFDAGAERPDWSAIERAAGVGRRQVERLFRARHGTSPARYWSDLKADAAVGLLREGHDVLGAALRSGHSGPGRLHDATVARTGMTPGQVRARGRGVRIAWGAFDTPLGHVLIAATERGVCALRLCTLKPPADHLDDLRAEWPAAVIAEDRAAVQAYADELVAWLERRTETFDPRIDVHGTAFQREVWTELRKLKAGETASYREIALRIGRPRAARAVGHACALNGIAIAVPCHRVLTSTGDLGGYRWGEEWKRKLLALEAEMRKRADAKENASR